MITDLLLHNKIAYQKVTKAFETNDTNRNAVQLEWK